MLVAKKTIKEFQSFAIVYHNNSLFFNGDVLHGRCRIVEYFRMLGDWWIFHHLCQTFTYAKEWGNDIISQKGMDEKQAAAEIQSQY